MLRRIPAAAISLGLQDELVLGDSARGEDLLHDRAVLDVRGRVHHHEDELLELGREHRPLGDRHPPALRGERLPVLAHALDVLVAGEVGLDQVCQITE